MLPLTGQATPSSHEELIAALRSGMQQHGLKVREVTASGGMFPQIDQLRVDLTGTALTRATRLPPSGGASIGAISVGSVLISGSPLRYENVPVDFTFNADDLDLSVQKDPAGNLSLLPTKASAGNISVQAQRSDLETLIQAFAAEAAAKQGAQVKSTRLTLTNRGPQAVDFRADVTAKVFVMTAVLSITGSVDVDETLQLRFSKLAATGDGMIANLAAGYLRSQFAELQAAPISLAAFSFGDVKLRSVSLTGGESVRLEAQFGS